MNISIFKKGFIVGIIFGTIISFSFLGYIYYVSKKSKEQSEKISETKNFKDLNLHLENLDGSPFDINQFTGKKILVNVWATWCAPCVKEMPLLQNTYNELKNDYIFIMISDEKPETIKSFMTKKGYNFTFVRSSESLKSKIGIFPTTFILDKSHNIKFSQSGSFEDMSESDFKALLLK
ncbi:TlpA disulfide reductase family protein [Chryseobacterium sp.]|jgi:thiol-disulfide isomerase/thioredoxin|uniref:TlpA family protein disulfide reductase n=1 Tax=Chryseobacterium sp. TaxID=1871047 RepID=UPI00283B2939|nr:TlpA disulfide reductase family protein [Chryseobacterium sp.]MDR3024788.1 TlpA family protein disulfide reductase [Chryseobacterium sp.]